MTLELQGQKKVRERLKSNPTSDIVFASEWAKSDLRVIEAELKDIMGQRVKGEESFGEIITNDGIEELVSAIHSALQEGDER